MSEINSIKLPDNVTYDIRDNSKTPQYSTMPTASASYADKIVQYIGTTDTYTNGYFYKCVSDGSSYSWVAQNVQAGGSGGQTVVSGTLLANATTVQLTNVAISSTSIIIPATENKDLALIDMSISGTTVTLTYKKAPTSNTAVKIVVI